jgi:hypothetical protein
VAWKRNPGIGLTDKDSPKRSSEDQTDKNTPTYSKPADGSNRNHEIHGPGKGAHTEESEIRPRNTPGADKPRRA